MRYSLHSPYGFPSPCEEMWYCNQRYSLHTPYGFPLLRGNVVLQPTNCSYVEQFLACRKILAFFTTPFGIPTVLLIVKPSRNFANAGMAFGLVGCVSGQGQ